MRLIDRRSQEAQYYCFSFGSWIRIQLKVTVAERPSLVDLRMMIYWGHRNAVFLIVSDPETLRDQFSILNAKPPTLDASCSF